MGYCVVGVVLNKAFLSFLSVSYQRTETTYNF